MCCADGNTCGRKSRGDEKQLIDLEWPNHYGQYWLCPVVPLDFKSRDMPHPHTICMHSEMEIAPTRHLLINRTCATNPLPCEVQYCKYHLTMVLGKSISTPKRKPSPSTDERGVFSRTCTFFEPHLRHFLPCQPCTA